MIMTTKSINQWRSVIFALAVVIILAILFGLISYFALVQLKETASGQLAAALPALAGMYGSLCTCAGFTIAFAFGKSLGEKAVSGTGVKGLLNTLMTDAKPGDPTPQG